MDDGSRRDGDSTADSVRDHRSDPRPEDRRSAGDDDRIPIAPSVDLDWTDRAADEGPVSTADAAETRQGATSGSVDASRDGDERRTSHDPDGPPPGSTSGRSPPGSYRFWAALTAGLGVVALLVAAVVLWRGPLVEAVGAALLGVTFLAVGVLGRGRPGLLRSLAAGWDEHRRYVGVTAGLFAFGVAGGVALGSMGYDLLELIVEFTGEDPFAGIEEAELTAWWFVRNNTIPFLVAIGGAVTLGLLTAYILLFNGLLVGNVAWFTGGVVGIDFVVVGIVPHGVFELTALFVAGGVGLRLVHRFGQRVLGTRDAILTGAYLRRTAALVGFAWLLLVLAAFVEAHVTGLLVEELFATRLEGLNGAQ